jgi:hypothetical protein
MNPYQYLTPSQESPSPDRSFEINIQPLVDNIVDQLNQHTEKLEEFLSKKVHGYIEHFHAVVANEIHNRETQKIVEEHAAAEWAIQNNGWTDFDPENTKDLIDDETYLIRTKGKNGQWKCPHLAYWDAEEKEFSLLHTMTFMDPIVHQYFKVPE